MLTAREQKKYDLEKALIEQKLALAGLEDDKKFNESLIVECGRLKAKSEELLKEGDKQGSDLQITHMTSAFKKQINLAENERVFKENISRIEHYLSIIDTI